MDRRSNNVNERLTRVIHSLQGLSCGDAFGERFFVHSDVARSLIAQRAIPSRPWRFTDDTAMAVAITEVLEKFGEIHPERLAENFGKHFIADPYRGYGPAMHTLLPELAKHPEYWKQLSSQLFEGRGSFGNGAAMRVAPVGAFFADDLEELVKQATMSAVITHSHPEGIAGAIAVALAAALAWRHKTSPVSPRDFLQRICERTPMSEVHLGIMKALALLENITVEQAASALGTGVRVSAQDTVPFCLWAAALHLNDYEEAMWVTVAGLGDRDTTCAIVGGIVALSAGVENIPPSWVASREPIPAQFLYPSPDQN
ncbi:MAG TPA: ADP-ribosylglycohydrolase family protein [Candidatus Sulfotelmatobacter sp.]|nr:ADP-ribosylglycohydrolase family protein [Candidatus Sulfotelmatobacter sp.]